MNRKLVAMMALAGLLHAAAATAQTTPPVETRPTPTDDRPEVRLSLAEALGRALENNLDLVAARTDPAIAAETITFEQATLKDPVLFATLAANGFKSEPSATFVVPGRGNSLEASAGAQQRFPFGGDIQASLFSQRRMGDGPLFEPFYTSGLSIDFNLPLLRNFGVETTKERLLLARGNLDISREELRRQAELLAAAVEGAYWNLVAAERALEVARLSLDRAGDLLGLNRKKVEVGTMAPIEITQAEAGVASQQEGVILAETTLGDAEDELRRLMAVPPDDPLWASRIRPTDVPTFATQQIDLPAVIAEALAHRPELVRARQEVKNSELSERVARGAQRPALDLQVQLNPSGNNNLGLDPGLDTIFGTDDDFFRQGSIGNSLDEIPKLNNYDWRTGLSFSVPLGNRAAEASYRIATLNRERAGVNLRNLEQNIRVEIRNAVRAVESGSERVAAAAENVRLQQKKLEAEQKKFENGLSTSFEVLTFQNDLASAELAEIRARLDYMRALAELERAKGTLLEARDMTLAP